MPSPADYAFSLDDLEVYEGGTVSSADHGAEDFVSTVQPDKRASDSCADITGHDEVFRLVRENEYNDALQLLDALPEMWMARDEEGHSLLHWSALMGNLEFVKKALKRDVPADAKANNKQTPLMWAIVNGHVSIVRELLAKTADVRSADSLGATPLMIAAQHPSSTRYQLILVLLEHGTLEILNDTDLNGCTTAHWSAYKGDLTALKLMVEFRADLQVLDKRSMLPLHRAVHGGQPTVIQYLIESRSDPKQRTSDGQDCFDLARRNRYILRLLAGDHRQQERRDEDPVEIFLRGADAQWLLPYYHSMNEVLLQVRSCQAPEDLRNQEECDFGEVEPFHAPENVSFDRAFSMALGSQSHSRMSSDGL